MQELIHKALFAVISGFSEFIFVPTAAHQLLYQTVTGMDLGDSLLSLGIHFGCLVALLMNCRKRIKHLHNENRLMRSGGKRGRGRQPDVASLMDIRVLNTSVFPLLLGVAFCLRATAWFNSPLRAAILTMINGTVLFLPLLFSSGNKNGRSFSRLDCFLLGMGGALGMLPGFSTMGCMYSIGSVRGTEKSYALELSILLSIPALCLMLCLDFYSCIAAGTLVTGGRILGALVAAVMSFLGARVGISMIRFICARATTAGFAYYNWGLATFLLLLYLFVA